MATRNVILTDARKTTTEGSVPVAVPIGASYTELVSQMNALNGGAGLAVDPDNEVVVRVDVTGTMPAGTQIVLTPIISGFPDLTDVTLTMDTVTDDVVSVRIAGSALIIDADHLKATYRFIQGAAAYSVTSITTQVKQREGAGGDAVLESSYETATQNIRMREINPLDTHYLSGLVDSVTNGVHGAISYYLDMATFKQFSLQCILNGGSGTVVVTLRATGQDDGTAAALCTYDTTDTMLDIFGVSSLSAALTTISDSLVDNAGKLGGYKFVEVTVTAATGGADDADWTLFAKRWY